MLLSVATGKNLKASNRKPRRDAGQYVVPPPTVTPCEENSLLPRPA
jgi:hypothetical protein